MKIFSFEPESKKKYFCNSVILHFHRAGLSSGRRRAREWQNDKTDDDSDSRNEHADRSDNSNNNAQMMSAMMYVTSNLTNWANIALKLKASPILSCGQTGHKQLQ